MLKIGSAQIKVIGFTRSAGPPKLIDGCETINLGRTKDGHLLERIGSVALTALRLTRLEQALKECQLVLARNLEMLFLATKARRRYAPDAALVYECLDIHRLLLRSSLPSRLLRWVENRLVTDTDLILTSSPRFVSEYFHPPRFNQQIKILENKLLLPDFGGSRPSQPSRPTGPPWKIGWYGMLRCRRSFEILSAVARDSGGNLEVVIAGRPSPKEFSDFERLVAAAPHVSFKGPYHFDELPVLYRDVHFSWAVDFFEQGLNSAWLLPNRIYESCFFGAIPIALEAVETARWLAKKQVGIALSGQTEGALRNVLKTMTDQRYRQLFDAVQSLPATELAETPDSCRQLVESLEKLKIPHA
jgi:succinoglycan biosynthesis protein ExoL